MSCVPMTMGLPIVIAFEAGLIRFLPPRNGAVCADHAVVGNRDQKNDFGRVTQQFAVAVTPRPRP